MVKQVALVALGTWALMFLATVLHRWVLFASLLPLVQVYLILAMAAHNLFPASLTGAPTLQSWFLAASLE